MRGFGGMISVAVRGGADAARTFTESTEIFHLAESLGAVGDVAAAGAWGDAAILSFNGNKVMTTSGGEE